jgi:hypothetical protein
MMYQIQNDFQGNPIAVTIVGQIISIPMNPANTDYANFKAQINADEAQLQDADGKTMTANKAKEFVATLP